MFGYCCEFYMRGVEVPVFDFRRYLPEDVINRARRSISWMTSGWSGQRQPTS